MQSHCWSMVTWLVDKVTNIVFPQVQSLQEQEKLAATPAHPDGLYGTSRSVCLRTEFK
jgi:hypothetical protein